MIDLKSLLSVTVQSLLLHFFIQKGPYSDRLVALLLEGLNMSEALKFVLENIEHMTSSERALAAHCLLSSLEEKPNGEVDSAWLAMSSGEVETVSWEQIKSQLVS